MIYVASDIHGNYEKYIQIFDTVKLTDDDTLFILGDVVDRGTGSMKILMDMMYRVNVIPLLGNHECMAQVVLKKLVETITDESIKTVTDDFLISVQTWFRNGGTKTCQEFKELSADDRLAVLEYLDEFEAYAEITINDKDYILVHSGLDNFRKNKRLSEYNIMELVWAETDYNKVYFDDKILVTGHTPVSAILLDKTADKILKQNNHIAIDCGCGYGRNLGLLCLDTMEEFYI